MKFIEKNKIGMAVMVISCNILLNNLDYGRPLPHQFNEEIS
jgi:hypothetical protein